jgi:hypothetical protein
MAIEESKVEYLKVWYSVFCVLVDAYTEGDFTDQLLIEKIIKLRNSLVTGMPEVEAQLLNNAK